MLLLKISWGQVLRDRPRPILYRILAYIKLIVSPLTISALVGGQDSWSIDMNVEYRPRLRIIKATSIPGNLPNSYDFFSNVFSLLPTPFLFRLFFIAVVVRRCQRVSNIGIGDLSILIINSQAAGCVQRYSMSVWLIWTWDAANPMRILWVIKSSIPSYRVVHLTCGSSRHVWVILLFLG
jgi:hypothetical protein